LRASLATIGVNAGREHAISNDSLHGYGKQACEPLRRTITFVLAALIVAATAYLYSSPI